MALVWILVWILALLGAMGMVIYGLGPVFQAREQRKLATGYRHAISQAANESTGLGGVSTPTASPDLGTPVAIIEIGAIHVQQVVVEGAFASQTQAGPGHVTGTAAPGQIGNSVVVGRAHAFGGTFGDIGQLKRGNTILISTTQGQSVYRVTTVVHKDLSNTTATYGRTADSRLTLVTSASRLPWNDAEGVVVVAALEGLPFSSTPQNGRVSTGLGTGGDSGADAAVILALFAFAGTISASIALYRRVRPATAYLLSIGPLIATAIIAGETLSRVFPAWM
ncbi:MAG TPA: sortase [Acidimicrobiales bacterium]|jgi:sortase A|nr:sortase [Acidimicrobiales bacterium]